jgi:alpha-tubulin suppressor-like RCC1 family protein
MKKRPTLRVLALAIAALSCSMGAAQAVEYQFHHRVSGMKPAASAAWGLSAQALPKANADRAYSFAFGDLITPGGLSGFTWNAQGLPAWASLDAATGQLTGTPSSADIGSSQFTVTATRQGTDGQQIYTIEVGGQVLEVSRIAPGTYHTCAVTPAGGATCWGRNNNGQLGDGSKVNRLTPVQVIGLTSGVTSISAGFNHGCAVMVGGALHCWGLNNYGQLGDGSTTNRLTPVPASSLSSGVGSVSVGNFHTCAKLTSAEARCWGQNNYGQVGDGSTTDRLTPVPVYGLGNEVSKITSGAYHSCIITTKGAVRCWGQNTYGQMGNGTDTNLTVPGWVSGLDSNVSDIASGYYHNCAVTTSGSTKCWGYNAYGQAGDGTRSSRLTPVDVQPSI